MPIQTNGVTRKGTENGDFARDDSREASMIAYRRFSIRLGIAALLFAALLIGQSGAGAATVPLKVLRVGFDPDFRPSSYTEKSGKMAGVDVEVATALAQHLGVRGENIGVAWDGIIPALQAHKIDAIGGMVITDKRKEVVAFSRPYAVETVTTVVRADSPPDFNPGKNDLSKLKVGVMVSTSAAQALAALPDVKPITYNTAADEYNDLLLKRIDVVVIESVNAGYTAKAIYPGKLRVTNADITGTKALNAYALRKEDTQLKEAIDAAIGAMIKDGTLQRIDKKWYGDINVIPTE
jgi:ABC-type amino acid transport substrate-binding protein